MQELIAAVEKKLDKLQQTLGLIKPGLDSWRIDDIRAHVDVILAEVHSDLTAMSELKPGGRK